MGWQSNKSGRDATTLLATMFVLLGGIFACTFFVVIFSVEPTRDVYLVAGGVVLVLVLSRLLRERPRGTLLERRYFWMIWRSREPDITVRLKRVEDPKLVQYGTNKPPTADAVREINENTSNWIPKKVSEKQLEQERRRRE